MNDSDFDAFAKAWGSAFELCSRGKVSSPGAINLAFEALRIYPLTEITKALTAHIRSPDAKYGLVPADIAALLDGPTPNPDQIIAAAMSPKTALAVLCRISIGTWNLNNWDRHQLRPAAENCIASLPEWKAKIDAGKLAEHEQLACLKYGVNPKSARLVGPAPELQKAIAGSES